MPQKPVRRRGTKSLPWYRDFDDTWYLPKIDGKAKAILDVEGRPVKGKENRHKAIGLWGETVARKDAPTRG